MYNLESKFVNESKSNLYISEITLAELKFGVENSAKSLKNRRVLQLFLNGVNVLPVTQSIDLFASEKAYLRKLGTPIDDFDLLIGVTAVNHNLTLVTNNTKHFKRIRDIDLIDWTK